MRVNFVLCASMAGRVDDPFESILFLEKSLQERGFKDGYEHGMLRGLEEGIEAGYNNGQEVAWEIGSYLGFTETWLKLIENQDEHQRKIRSLSTLNDRLQRFPILNTSSTGYRQEFSQLQTKYKQVLALLNISRVKQDDTQISF